MVAGNDSMSKGRIGMFPPPFDCFEWNKRVAQAPKGDNWALERCLCGKPVAVECPEVGSELNTVTHIYHYEDYDHRDKVRSDMRKNEEWQIFLRKSLGMVEEQTSEVYIEATVATKSAGLHVNSFKEKAASRKSSDDEDSSSIFEIRTYTLQLGYNPIPKMQNLYAEGLPSKIASDTEKLSELVWIGYADVGDLNKFVEIWKYPSYQSHIKVREAARTADAWRETIGKIAPMVTHFNTTLCSAAPFSPVK